GEWVPVYNVRVADFHTYFVGCEEWGFSVWAHNAYIILRRYKSKFAEWRMAHWSVEIITNNPKAAPQLSHQINDFNPKSPGAKATIGQLLAWTPTPEIVVLANAKVGIPNEDVEKTITIRVTQTEAVAAKTEVSHQRSIMNKPNSYSLLTNSCF